MSSLGRPLCRATTNAGNPCKRRACSGSAFCGVHGGSTRRVGNETKLDDGLIDELAKVVELGVTWDVAAAAAGIAVSTLHKWRQRGNDDVETGTSSVYRDLVERLTRATAEAERKLITTIVAHGPVDWRAAAWVLERRAPERWAKRDKIDVDVNERAKPRDVVPGDERRDLIVSILATATRPPANPDA